MSSCKYATELLGSEGFELLYKRTDVTLDSCGEISKFLKKLSAVVSDYGKALGKLAKEAQKSSKSVDQELVTLKNSWDVLLFQLDALAEQHNKFAAGALTEVSASIAAYQREKEKDRKKNVLEGQRLTKELSDSMANLKAAQKHYIARCEEADKAQARYLKAKNDSSIKPKDLNQLAVKSTQANDKANTADKDYQTALKAANERQRRFYEQESPKLLEDFQKFEEEREAYLKQMLDKVCSAHNEFPPFYQTVCSKITEATQAISIVADTDSFVKANRTNVRPPPDIPYEPYNRENPAAGGSNSATSMVGGSSAVGGSSPGVGAVGVSAGAGGSTPISVMSPKPAAIGGTGASASSRALEMPKVGLGPGDESLSKEQKRDKLEGQLRDVRAQLQAEVKSKKGLEKLVKFYGNDAVQQEKAREQLESQTKKVSLLREAKRTVERQLADVTGGEYKASADDHDDDDGPDGTAAAAAAAGAPKETESKSGGGAVYTTAFPTVTAAKPAAAAGTAANAPTNAAPAGIGGAPGAKPAEGAAPVGKARALYDYEATNENELSFPEGAILNIQEQDDSGWWFAELNGKTGFIPNNYVEAI